MRARSNGSPTRSCSTSASARAADAASASPSAEHSIPRPRAATASGQARSSLVPSCSRSAISRWASSRWPSAILASIRSPWKRKRAGSRKPVAPARSATPSSVRSAAAASASESSRKPRVASNSSSADCVPRCSASREALLDLRPGGLHAAEVRLDDRLHREGEGPLADLPVAHARVLAFVRVLLRGLPVPRQELEARQREEDERQRVLVAAIERLAMEDARTHRAPRRALPTIRRAGRGSSRGARATCDQGGACSSDSARSIVAIATPSPPSVSRKATSASAPARTVGVAELSRPAPAPSARTRARRGTLRVECRHHPRPSRISIRSLRSSVGSASAAKKTSAPALNPSSCAQTQPSRTSARARRSP